MAQSRFDVEQELSKAVKHFWATRGKQGRAQGSKTGKKVGAFTLNVGIKRQRDKDAAALPAGQTPATPATVATVASPAK